MSWPGNVLEKKDPIWLVGWLAGWVGWLGGWGGVDLGPKIARIVDSDWHNRVRIFVLGYSYDRSKPDRCLARTQEIDEHTRKCTILCL